MAVYLEELENLRPVKLSNSRDWEQFADILDITIITYVLIISETTKEVTRDNADTTSKMDL